MISLVINVDNRPGSDRDKFAVGDCGNDLHAGVRSNDFLTHGIFNKIRFFEGHEIEVIVYIDQHETTVVTDEIDFGQVVNFHFYKHDHSHPRWNDFNYLRALRLAKGDYIAHFDQDMAAYRRVGVDPVGHFVKSLETHSFICYPINEPPIDMHASTRFFMCKRETLDFNLMEKALTNDAFRDSLGHMPCLEHIMGALFGGVYYPTPNYDKYMIFSWSTYYKGLMKRLEELPYDQVKDYILKCGIYGAADCVAQLPFP